MKNGNKFLSRNGFRAPITRKCQYFGPPLYLSGFNDIQYIAQGLRLILDSFQSSKQTEVNTLPPPVVGEHIFFL